MPACIMRLSRHSKPGGLPSPQTLTLPLTLALALGLGQALALPLTLYPSPGGLPMAGGKCPLLRS